MGRLATGKITSGTVNIGDAIQVLNRDDEKLSDGKITKIFVSRGVEKIPVTSACAGDIVTIAGVEAFVSDTICNPAVTKSIETPKLDPPTISMTFSVNDSPLGGKEGKFLTSSKIKDRLIRESQVRDHVSMNCGLVCLPNYRTT